MSKKSICKYLAAVPDLTNDEAVILNNAHTDKTHGKKIRRRANEIIRKRAIMVRASRARFLLEGRSLTD